MPPFSLKRWTQICGDFYDKYPGLKKWQDENFRKVMQNKGRLTNPTGRKFLFHMVRGKYGMEYRRPQVCNYPVQSFATADMVPVAMIEIFNRLRYLAPEARFCNQVHDDVMYDTKEKHVDTIVKTMSDVFVEMPELVHKYFGIEMNVPMKGEVKVGYNWMDMKEVA